MIEFTHADKPYGLYSGNFINIEKWLEQIILEEGYKTGEINIINCSDDYLLDKNIQYLGHNYYTDVITFDYVIENIISGDIFISEDRIIDNAKAYHVTSTNEFLRILSHGILHLCGYKDSTQAEKEEIRDKENYYLNKFNYASSL